MPSLARGYYWQPVFKEFSKLLPNTLILTTFWPGFLPGYEGTFRVRCLADFKFITLRRASTSYESGLIWAPPVLIRELLRFRPHAIYATGFSLWTLYALAVKAATHCRLILVYDGVSPTMAYLHSPVRLATRRLMARFIDGSVSNTQEGLDYLRDVLGMPESKLLRHPYQVPEVDALCSGCQDGCGLPSSISHPVFLYVGSIVKRKGWRTLLEATYRLVQQGLDSFSVVFVGGGEEAEELSRLISSFGLAKVVHQIGQVRYENLGAYLRACDVFVLPTLEDIWAVAPLEAMAFEKAVLCSRHAGAKEMVQQGRNGFIFDPHDPPELADCMARFIHQPELIPQFGACSKQMISPYTPRRAATVLASVPWGVPGLELRSAYGVQR